MLFEEWIDDELQRRSDILFDDEDFCDCCGRITYADQLEKINQEWHCEECLPE